MKYVPPIGGADDAHYVDGDPSRGVEGSAVPAAAIEHPMREIEAVIAASGQTPSKSILNQLLLALRLEGVFSTPAADDKSTKAATTAWLYSAIETVMIYFGFACSLGANGYIKFPSILGSVIIQWGGGVLPSGVATQFSLPIAFPNACFRTFGSNSDGPSAFPLSTYGGANLGQITMYQSSGANRGVTFYAFGK